LENNEVRTANLNPTDFKLFPLIGRPQHAEKCIKVAKTVREKVRKWETFTPSELVRRNGFSLPTAERCLEELAEKKVELNGQIRKLGKAGRATIYQYDDPTESKSNIKQTEVFTRPDHFDRTRAIPFT
jgi:hypothetical protein